MQKYNNILLSLKNKKTIILLALSLFSLFSSHVFLKMNRNTEIEVMFLDVGQGDSALIKLPKGQNIVIDTGSNYLTNQKLEKQLFYFNKKIDALILTHPDLDHVGGAEEILKVGNVKNTIESTENTYSTEYFNYNTTVSRINTKNYISFDGLDIFNVNPDFEMSGDGNHKSIINIFNYGNFRFIFTGDADAEIERRLIFKGVFEKNNNIQVDKVLNILKVGHHGSDTSSSEIFLKKLKPEYCIISVGLDNKYNHPNKKTLERLYKYCKNIYRTDLDGSISFKTNGKHLNIKSSRK